jgi:hypothetical protein
LLDDGGKIVVRDGRGDEPNAPTIDRTLPVERGDGGCRAFTAPSAYPRAWFILAFVEAGA